MDVQKKLDQIVASVEGARSMPMSASCVVNRAGLLAMLEEVRSALPDSLSQAQALLGGREQLVEDARAEATRIIESAHAERGSLVSDTEIVRTSRAEADRILAEARREAGEIRAEADDYVDSKLANFEVVLTKTIGSVDRGREKLLGRGPGAGEQGHPDDEDAPERSSDPETLRRRADEYVDAKLGAFEAVLSKTLQAVGRGRLKLTGHRAVDDLGAHLAAQDAEGPAAAHQTDAEYLAGLADPQPVSAPAPVQIPAQIPAQQTYGYDAAGYGYQADPYQQDQYPQQGFAQQGYQELGSPVPEAGGYDQDYGWQQQGYGQAGAVYSPETPQIPHQQQYGGQQAGALDETSFFDTGMIDLDRLRELEQGR